MIPLELLETGIISRLERSGDFLDGCTEEAPDWFWIWRYLCSLRVEPGVLLLHAAQELPPLLYIHQTNHLTHPSTLPCLSILVHARTFDRDPATRFTRDVETPGCDPSVSSVTHFRTLLHRSLSFRTSDVTTAAMSVRRAAAHLPSRSVHLRIVPRPANLSESREIFRVLQRFGEINTYKHLRVCQPIAAGTILR